MMSIRWSGGQVRQASSKQPTGFHVVLSYIPSSSLQISNTALPGVQLPFQLAV